jgi:hypothetical protein
MRNVNCNVLSGSDAISVNGIQINANQLINPSFQAVFGDATAVGTFSIQASNDIDTAGNLGAPFVVKNWTLVPGATTSITAGASSLIALSEVNFRWLRAVYVSTSGGSTTVSVNMNAVGV